MCSKTCHTVGSVARNCCRSDECDLFNIRSCFPGSRRTRRTSRWAAASWSRPTTWSLTLRRWKSAPASIWLEDVSNVTAWVEIVGSFRGCWISSCKTLLDEVFCDFREWKFFFFFTKKSAMRDATVKGSQNTKFWISEIRVKEFYLPKCGFLASELKFI